MFEVDASNGRCMIVNEEQNDWHESILGVKCFVHKQQAKP
jgi:hypothetical protein